MLFFFRRYIIKDKNHANEVKIYTNEEIVEMQKDIDNNSVANIDSETEKKPAHENVKIADTNKISENDAENNDQSAPVEMNLDVPFASQAPQRDWSLPWQDACEEAAVLMLDAYYKDYKFSPLFLKDEINKLIDWEQSQEWGNSIPIENVLILAQENFKLENLKIIENPTVENIKDYIRCGSPVLAVAYGKDLPNPYFRNGGPVYHALIIRGFTKDSFITNDPGTNTLGENFKYKYTDLLNAVHDWNGGDVPNGKGVVLVKECTD
jgi:hypothetical protein